MGRCDESGNHQLLIDLAKSDYKPDMKYKSLIFIFYFWLLKLNIKNRQKWPFFIYDFSGEIETKIIFFYFVLLKGLMIFFNLDFNYFILFLLPLCKLLPKRKTLIEALKYCFILEPIGRFSQIWL
jgi:hypothetical protein